MSAKDMGLHVEFQHAMKKMDRGDQLSILRILEGDLVDTPNLSTPSSPPPPDVPAGQNSAIHPQPKESLFGGGDGGDSSPAAAPVMAAPVDRMQHVSSAVASCSAAPPQTCNNVLVTRLPEGLTQNLRPVGLVYGELVYEIPADVIPFISAAPLQTCNNVSLTKLPEELPQNLRPVGIVNGELVYEIPEDCFAPPNSAAPPSSPNTSKSKEPKLEDQQDIIKMPLNAFMLFLKEQRPHFAAELATSGGAMVNTMLGQRWRALSKKEKAKYHEAARKEKQLFKQQHPG